MAGERAEPGLWHRGKPHLDEAVLRLLNRLKFIRRAEDREVEPLRLMPLLRELENKHQLDKLSVKLAELFR